MPSRLRRTGLQDIKELVWIKVSKKTLEQNNYQVFSEDWLYPH